MKGMLTEVHQRSFLTLAGNIGPPPLSVRPPDAFLQCSPDCPVSLEPLGLELGRTFHKGWPHASGLFSVSGIEE